MRNFFKLGARNFHFPKYKKTFFMEKYKNFFQSGFFLFFKLGLKSVPGSPIIHYSPSPKSIK